MKYLILRNIAILIAAGIAAYFSYTFALGVLSGGAIAEVVRAIYRDFTETKDY